LHGYLAPGGYWRLTTYGLHFFKSRLNTMIESTFTHGQLVGGIVYITQTLDAILDYSCPCGISSLALSGVVSKTVDRGGEV
jgi:hypothetical protein